MDMPRVEQAILEKTGQKTARHNFVELAPFGNLLQDMDLSQYLIHCMPQVDVRLADLVLYELRTLMARVGAAPLSDVLAWGFLTLGESPDHWFLHAPKAINHHRMFMWAKADSGQVPNHHGDREIPNSYELSAAFAKNLIPLTEDLDTFLIGFLEEDTQFYQRVKAAGQTS